MSDPSFKVALIQFKPKVSFSAKPDLRGAVQMLNFYDSHSTLSTTLPMLSARFELPLPKAQLSQ